MARKPVQLQKENPAGCVGEGKQRKGNTGEEKGTDDSDKFKFRDKMSRRSCEGREGMFGRVGEGEGGVVGE